MSIVDLKDLHQAYTRLSEKFKTLWTFHQFLQGIHKTFFQDTPPYKIDFQTVYNEIKANIISHMNRLNPDLVG